MALNDVFRPLLESVAARKAVAAVGETTVNLTGADTGGRVGVPCRTCEIRTVGGADLKFSTMAGEITAGRYLTIPGGKKTILGLRSPILYFQASANDTVEVHCE